MTIREGEYEDGSTEIMLEKFADSFGFVVLTKRLERNGLIWMKYHLLHEHYYFFEVIISKSVF